jgi:isochorismate synthase
MNSIYNKIVQHKKENLPFVIYKKPNDTPIVGLFQKNNTLFKVANFTEKGFVIASFDGTQTYLIPENESESITESIVVSPIAIADKRMDFPSDFEKDNYIKLVNKGIQAIKNKTFKKVVLSRKESVAIKDFDLSLTFKKLVQLYPNAFVYCFFHPKIGTWIGATPEQLLKANDLEFSTIALAATQKDKGLNEVIWGNKEKEEQQFVTDFIVDTLNDLATNVSVSAPYSIKAGTIWHIKTDIKGTLKPDFGLQEVIRLLHPTPAVCGLPKEKAKTFIIENENYNRTFYSGYLGELNSSFSKESISSNLFVNLRCMEIEEDQAHLFMGCGITNESVPEKEWEESVNKSRTMKTVLTIK